MVMAPSRWRKCGNSGGGSQEAQALARLVSINQSTAFSHVAFQDKSQPCVSYMSLSSVTTDSKAMSIAKNGVPQPRSTLPSTSPHLVVLRHTGVKPCKSLRR